MLYGCCQDIIKEPAEVVCILSGFVLSYPCLGAKSTWAMLLPPIPSEGRSTFLLPLLYHRMSRGVQEPKSRPVRLYSKMSVTIPPNIGAWPTEE